MNTMQEIIDGLDKLNGSGLDAIQGVMSGLLTSAILCKDTNQKGLIIHMFLTKTCLKPRKDIFKQLDKAEPSGIIDLSAHRKVGGAL